MNIKLGNFIMNEKNKFLLTAVLICAIFGLYWISTKIMKPPNVEIENLNISYYNIKNELLHAKNIPKTTTRYLACGELLSTESVNLTLAIRKPQVNIDYIYYGHNDTKKEVIPGDFCINLIITNKYLNPGEYILEVIFQHNTIAQESFTVH